MAKDDRPKRTAADMAAMLSAASSRAKADTGRSSPVRAPVSATKAKAHPAKKPTVEPAPKAKAEPKPAKAEPAKAELAKKGKAELAKKGKAEPTKKPAKAEPAAKTSKAPAKKKKKGNTKLVVFDPPSRTEARPARPALLAWSCGGRTASRASCTLTRVGPPLEVRWRVKLSGPAAAAPVVAPDGVVYACDREGGLLALDIDDGYVLGTRRTDAVRESSPAWPLVGQGLVPADRVPWSGAPALTEWHLFLGDDEGIFYAVRRGEDVVLWRKQAALGLAARQGRAYQAPLVAGEHVVTVDAEGNLHAATTRGGATAYTRYLSGPPASAPVVSAPRVLVATLARHPGDEPQVHALHVDTGERLWHRPLPGPPGPLLLATPDLVLVGGAWGVVALRLDGGDEVWRAPDLAPSGPGAHDGQALVVPVAGALACRDLATGASRWTGHGRSAAPPLPGTSPTIAGDVVWTAAEGALIAWDLASGEALGRVKVPGDAVGGPVIAGEGVVLVATTRGEVVALGPAS